MNLPTHDGQTVGRDYTGPVRGADYMGGLIAGPGLECFQSVEPVPSHGSRGLSRVRD